jgi:hypothetical protein
MTTPHPSESGEKEPRLLEAAGFDPRETPSRLPDSLFERMKGDPAHAPEHLALAAVERLGPEAAQWVGAYRQYYPWATDGQLVAIIRARFVRLSRYSGAAAGVAGAFGAVVDAGVLAWNQARMVLYIAAIYGADPTAQERAAELLTLQQVYKVIDRARTALDVASRRVPAGAMVRHGGSLAAVGLALAKMAGVRVAKRAVLKAVPFASVPLGALANAGSTKALADRAIALYSQPTGYPPAPGQPAVDQPEPSQPAASPSTVDQPPVDQPTVDQPAASQLPVDQPSGDPPASS